MKVQTFYMQEDLIQKSKELSKRHKPELLQSRHESIVVRPSGAASPLSEFYRKAIAYYAELVEQSGELL